MSHPRIVTFSRRTDTGLWIDFLIDRIQRGGTFVPNPLARKPYWVWLAPDDAAPLNLWTKAPHRLLPAPEKLKVAYDLAFLVAVTGFGGTWIAPKVSVRLRMPRRRRGGVAAVQVATSLSAHRHLPNSFGERGNEPRE